LSSVRCLSHIFFSNYISCRCCTVFVTSFTHLPFTLLKITKFLNSILLQLIIFLLFLFLNITICYLTTVLSTTVSHDILVSNVWTTLCSLLQKGCFPLSAPPLVHLFCQIPNLKHANQIFHLNSVAVHVSSLFLSHVPVQDWMIVFFRFFPVAMSLNIVIPSVNYLTDIVPTPISFQPNVSQPNFV